MTIHQRIAAAASLSAQQGPTAAEGGKVAGPD